MTQRKYVPKHENPLGYGFEEFLLSDMSREELADRFLTAKEELSEELAHAFGAFVGASYLLNHTKTLVGLLEARTDLTPEEQQEIDYLKQNINLYANSITDHRGSACKSYSIFFCKRKTICR